MSKKRGSGRLSAGITGADHREPEMPAQRDRLTMARRVRGYVLPNDRSEVPRVLFLGLCLDFHYFLGTVAAPKL